MSAEELLISAHDGDMALLYIWLSTRRSDDKRQAALDLCMTMSQLEAADEKLRLAGIHPLVSAAGRSAAPAAVSAPVPAPADEPASYSAEEISRTSREDSGFHAVCDAAARAFGKLLTRDELSRLLNIYRNLGLPADVILVLLNFCVQISDRRPTMRFVESLAYRWVNSGISDAEQAEQFAEEQLRRRSQKGRIREILGLSSVKLTPKREEILDSWISAGYTESQIEEAYDITLSNTGKLAWEYLNKVLLGMSESAQKPAEEAHPLPLSIRKKKD